MKMLKKSVAILLSITFLCTLSNASNIKVYAAQEELTDLIEGRRLVWHDEFNSNQLDPDNWSFELGNVRTNELQYYTNREENVRVENGTLVINAIRENYEDKGWTSGSIHSNNLQEFKYGRMEAKMKLPNVVGSFPAFWMLGASYQSPYTSTGNETGWGQKWPNCGEIDMMEQMPGNQTYVNAGIFYGDPANVQTYKFPRSQTINTSEWHIYGMEWTESSITMYVDGRSVGTLNTAYSKYDAFRQPFFFLFDLAIGKSGGTPSASTNDMKLYVDWVRVYAPVGVNTVQTTHDFSLSTNSVSLTAVNEKYQIYPDFGGYVDNATVTWDSSDRSVAVCYGGSVKAVGDGTCTITATDAYGNSETCNVTVNTGTSPSPVVPTAQSKTYTINDFTERGWRYDANGIKTNKNKAGQQLSNTLPCQAITNFIDVGEWDKLTDTHSHGSLIVNEFNSNKEFIKSTNLTNPNQTYNLEFDANTEYIILHATYVNTSFHADISYVSN